MNDDLVKKDFIEKDFGPFFGTGVYSGDSLFTSMNSTMHGTFMDWMVQTNRELPAWWSPARDRQLRRHVISNNFLGSAVYTLQLLLYGMKFAVKAKDTSIDKHLKMSEAYNDVFQRAISSEEYEKFIFDLLVCDNGGFLFVEGDSPSHRPLLSVPTGFTHLDSHRCQRTGDKEFPVVFWTENADGGMFPLKIHETRIMMLSQMPSPAKNMNSVGISFVSRAFALAETLLDIQTYEGEALGSRSSEEVIYATGAKSDDLQNAFEAANIESDNAGLTRIGKRVFIGLRDQNAKLGKMLLKNLPENFDKRDYVEIGLVLFALAAGVSPNVFFDSVKSGSTRASAQVSDVINQRKLPSWYVNKITQQLKGKFLPDALEIVLPQENEDTDGTKARIKANLAIAREKNLATKTSNIRIEREKQQANGELTHAQFEQLELEDGRLASGLPIQALFFTDQKQLFTLLNIFEKPLDFELHSQNREMLEETLHTIDDGIQAALSFSITGRTSNQQKDGRLAYYALLWLKKQYTQIKNNVAEPTDVILVNDNIQQFAQTTQNTTEDGIVENENNLNTSNTGPRSVTIEENETLERRS